MKLPKYKGIDLEDMLPEPWENKVLVIVAVFLFLAVFVHLTR